MLLTIFIFPLSAGLIQMVSTTVLAKLNVETTDFNDKLSISGGKISERFLRRKKMKVQSH
jgi:hypothetical protein